MKKGLFVLSFAVALCAPLDSQARNVVHYFNFQKAVNAAIAAGRVDTTVKFYLEGVSVPGEVIQRFSSVTAKKAAALDTRSTAPLEGAAAITSNKNVFGESGVESACTEALSQVLVVFQKKAKKFDANALIDVVGFFKDREYSDKAQYECHEGSSKVIVTMRGRMVILK